MRQTYEAAAKQTGVIPSAIANQPQCPDDLLHVWGWLEELLDSCSNPMGRMPLSYAEIWSWAQLTGRAPSQLEVELLRSADRVIRAATAKDE